MTDRNDLETNEYEYRETQAEVEWELFCKAVEHERVPITPQQLLDFKNMDAVLATMSSEELQLAFNEYIAWYREDLQS